MRTVTEEELGRLFAALPPDPRVVAGGNGATPRHVLGVLDAQVPAYRLFMLNAHPGVPTRPGVVHETPFVGPGMRRSPTLSYLPARLSLVPTLFAVATPPDVVCVTVAPAVDGQLSLGTEVNVLPAAIEACRARGGLVVAQVNRKMPWTYGDASARPDGRGRLPRGRGCPRRAVDAPSPTTRRAGSASGWRRGSATAPPCSWASGWCRTPPCPGSRSDAGSRCGRRCSPTACSTSTGPARSTRTRVLTASFLFGSAALYAWLHRNPRVRMMRTETTNAPALIAANRAMTSINTALQVDLFGQANASRIDARIHSGFGGQTDFIVGALHSAGGQAMMALRSWHPKADVSTIVPLLDEPVTSFQHTAVVTEQGVAEIFGHDERSQAAQLIENAAHPRVREELWEEAFALGLAART